jgi:hypothetical protein
VFINWLIINSIFIGEDWTYHLMLISTLVQLATYLFLLNLYILIVIIFHFNIFLFIFYNFQDAENFNFKEIN